MKLHCDIQLPASKSESHRALMIAAYGGFSPDFQNLSDSNDTLVLAKALREIEQNNSVINIADCGTAARFMTTFLACREGDWLLTGTERMKQRPIAPLVLALRTLGAEIQYAGEDGFLPLRIHGKPLNGGKVALDVSQSSQFASSLLLAASMWSQGLELELLGELNSLPYLDMTIVMMRHFGAEVERIGRNVFVKPKAYQPRSFTVSADWSAASYWYEMAALSEECEIRLRGLSLDSLQGDAIIVEWMKSLGVNTIENGDSIVLKKTPFEKKPLYFGLSAHPDLFPAMVATCAGLQVEAHFTDVANLCLKESNRVEAMRAELGKIGMRLEYASDNEVVLLPSMSPRPFVKTQHLQLSAHSDHRIVMALAPLAMKFGQLLFDHAEVVAKSYPRFWQDADFLRFWG